MALGYPIGASSIPVGMGCPEGNSVPLGGVSKGAERPLAHDFPSGKSSVLYLLLPLALERDCVCGYTDAFQ